MVRPMSWLASETSRRYYKLMGLQPVLILKTRDDAILSSDDPISVILASKEEVRYFYLPYLSTNSSFQIL